MNLPQRLKPVVMRSPAQFFLFALACLVGCDDPIQRDYVATVATSSFSSLTPSDGEFDDWPLSASGYRVQRPSPLPFVRSFNQKIKCPDPKQSDIVPWDKDKLTEALDALLSVGYGDAPTSPDVIAKIPRSDFVGDQAFDVSRDGRRLVVLTNRSSLALYDMATGKGLGERKLDSEITGQSTPVTAVRFCSEGKDILMAGTSAIFRLSGDTGRISARTTMNLGEISQWWVAPDDSVMAIRNESGEVFLGRPDLSSIQAVMTPGGLPSKQIALLDSGKAMMTIADKTTHYAIVDGITPGSWREGSGSKSTTMRTTPGMFAGRTARRALAMGKSTLVVADDDTLTVEYGEQTGQRRSVALTNHWRPTQIYYCDQSASERDNFLMVAERLGSSTNPTAPTEWILYHIDPVRQTYSIPLTIPFEPIRVAHDRDGQNLAMLYEDGLQIYRHDPTRNVPSPHDAAITQALEQKKFEEIDYACRVIRSQTRLAYGLTPAEFESAMLESLASRWHGSHWATPKAGIDYAEIKRLLDEWVETGSEVALTASAIRHARVASAQRGIATTRSLSVGGVNMPVGGVNVSAGRQKEFRRTHERALAQCAAALTVDTPPLAAYDYWIRCKAELGGDLDDIDEMCQRAATEYPGEVSPHETVCFLLTNRLGGEVGDSASHGRSVARLFSRQAGSQLYFRLLGGVRAYTDPGTTEAWSSYDRGLMIAGIDNAIASGRYPSINEWFAIGLVAEQFRDPDLAERWLRHLVRVTPFMSTQALVRSPTFRQPYYSLRPPAFYQPMLNRMWRDAP